MQNAHVSADPEAKNRPEPCNTCPQIYTCLLWPWGQMPRIQPRYRLAAFYSSAMSRAREYESMMPMRRGFE